MSEPKVEQPRSTLVPEQIYSLYVAALPDQQQLELISLIVGELGQRQAEPADRKRSILELEGCGVDLWRTVDIEAYVNELRDEWAVER